jgi:TldD protein
MKDGKIQEIRSGSDFGGSVRVLKNGSWGFAYTTQISRLDEMAESALKLAKSLKSDVELSKVEISTDNVKFKAKLLTIHRITG